MDWLSGRGLMSSYEHPRFPDLLWGVETVKDKLHLCTLENKKLEPINERSLGRSMHLSLQTDQLQHYGFLSGSAGPGPSRTMTEVEETVEVTRKIAKFAYLGPSQGPMHQGRSKPTEPMSLENHFLTMLAAGTCASAVRASEHKHWSHASHSPLLPLVDWMDLAPVTFPDD